MINYIIRRFFYLFAVLIVVSLITFGLLRAVPGGPFDREKPLPKATLEQIEHYYKLDRPFLVQYLSYLSYAALPRLTSTPPSTDRFEDYLIQFPIGNLWFKWLNFGPSMASSSRTVNDIFRQQLPVSFQLGIIAFVIALVIGVPLGIFSALNQNTYLDYFGMSVAIFGVSVPTIVLAPLMVWIFGVWLKWLPPTGWGAKPPYFLGFFPTDLSWNFFKYAIMPSLVLGFGSSAVIARLTRASLLQVIQEDYIRTARAKGLSEQRVIFKHALKNALIPVVTIIGPMFASLVTGTFVTELVFSIPGIGRYFVTSITNRDHPMVMGTILLFAVFLVIANLVVDILYAYLDPRIRYD